MKDCNPSPFPDDKRCVCGPKFEDWRSPAQCAAPTHAPTTARPSPSSVTCKGQSSCSYNGQICPATTWGGGKYGCGFYCADGSFLNDQCKPSVGTSSQGGCPCWYDGAMKDCNPSPFP